MTYETLVVEPRPPSVWLMINRPDARNAVNPQVMGELIDALEAVGKDETTRVVVLTGAGDRAFCAGGDLAGGTMEQGAIAQHFDRTLLSQLFRKMRGLEKPVVARVNGHALGGGFGLALACDLIVASEDAEFGTPEINIGLWPFVITAVIQRNVPTKVAMEMMMMGKRMGATDAARWGLVNWVVPSSELDEAVDEVVGELASKSPLVLRLGKESFYGAQDMDFEDALRYLENVLTVGLQSEDVAEGISAFFAKRKPQWKGR